MMRSGEHRSKSSIRTTRDSIFVSFSILPNCSRKDRTSRGPEGDVSFLISSSQSTSSFLDSAFFSILTGSGEPAAGALEPASQCRHGSTEPSEPTIAGTRDVPPDAKAAIAGRATCFNPRLATRIQLTDLSRDTHLSLTFGPNR